MKSNRTKLSVSALIAVLSFLFVVGAVSRPVRAQYQTYPYGQDRNDRDRYDRDRNRRGRNWDNYGNYGGSFDLRQTALNAGYNEGIKEGRNDRNNRRSDFRNKSAYQKATTDYSSKLGDRGLYQRYYREGFENGYYDGLNGN